MNPETNESTQAGKPVLFNSAFEGHQIRVLGTPDEPLFVLADVCEVLELSNPRMVAGSLDDDEIVMIDLRNTVSSSDGISGNPNANAVTESGLYHVIFQSRKPEAKRFRKWVTSEVLPTIRRTGAYSLAASNDPRVRRLELRLAAERMIAQARAMQAEARTIFLTARRSSLENNPEGWMTLRAFLASNGVTSTSDRYPSLCTRMGHALMSAEHGTDWVWGARNQVRSLIKTYNPETLSGAWDSVNGDFRIVAESGTARVKGHISKAEINGMFKALSDQREGASN